MRLKHAHQTETTRLTDKTLNSEAYISVRGGRSAIEPDNLKKKARPKRTLNCCQGPDLTMISQEML